MNASKPALGRICHKWLWSCFWCQLRQNSVRFLKQVIFPMSLGQPRMFPAPPHWSSPHPVSPDLCPVDTEAPAQPQPVAHGSAPGSAGLTLSSHCSTCAMYHLPRELGNATKAIGNKCKRGFICLWILRAYSGPVTALSPGKTAITKRAKTLFSWSFYSNGRQTVNKELHHILDVESKAWFKITQEPRGQRWE